MKLFRVIAAIALAVLGLAFTGPAQAADTAQVSVVHGIPGATVDVYANGKALLTDFKPGTVAGPLTVPAGSYDLKVVKAGAGAGGAAVVEAKGAKVPAGANVTVVAHLTADGKPALTPYVNDTSKIAAGKARLTVRHDAAAPAVDVRADGKVAFEGLTNPKEVKADLPASTIKADVVLAGTSTVAIGPATLNLAEGTNTIVYAWGSATDKNLALAVQVIKGLHSNPTGIPAGTAAPNDTGRWLLVSGAALVAALSVLMLTRGRARRETASRAE
ncbi:MAG: DUF4397 domain-containing protein [Intrasporangium sp.]|uniref:DUF4397 domain-containing protein n=1 Tax=Intrasporangium sp. TaxID=1925024 RepID=UPI00264A180A|nr:DUF4397 domain-containing protein [Intrasporangium sp.]MDN5796185.1 DUF4397 domain-containing protein [Intrasporangium sp.]